MVASIPTVDQSLNCIANFKCDGRCKAQKTMAWTTMACNNRHWCVAGMANEVVSSQYHQTLRVGIEAPAAAVTDGESATFRLRVATLSYSWAHRQFAGGGWGKFLMLSIPKLVAAYKRDFNAQQSSQLPNGSRIKVLRMLMKSCQIWIGDAQTGRALLNLNLGQSLLLVIKCPNSSKRLFDPKPLLYLNLMLINWVTNVIETNECHQRHCHWW